MPNVDSLNISISATAQKASGALDTLIGKLGHLQTSISSINTGGLNNMAHGINAVSSAMGSLKNVNAADFNRLANGIQKLGSIDAATITRAAGSINLLGNSIGKVSNANFSGTTQIADLAKAIAQLGYKSSTQAVENIPKLAVAMNQLITSLSKAPKVSQNVIDLTNALAKLARTGASSGKAATSLGQSLNLFSNSAKKAKTSSFSLASAIGKVYATYWLLFRAFGKIKEAMDLSSALTEVQNVVDVTFGNASSVIEKFAETSIAKFGISELAAKKTASTYQAMGTAMGFTQGKMAEMSVELTALSADMASFYNVSQEDVAEDLQAVFTGMTRPLRQYGLDLTEATLKEWALKNGMDANIKSMSQAEKTMLRYQYVLANTGASQGDFQRTQLTWANQVRILTENFKALGSVIGGMFTNAFRPLVIAINSVMGKLIQFAEVVSNSLGKIFGWQYQKGGGGMTNEFEDSAGYSDDIADSTGKAAKNVDKMKKGLRVFDELKTIDLGDSSSSGGSGGSDGSGGGTGSGDGNGGQWTKVESIWENYESSLDSLYKLGEYIGTTLTDALNSINWDNVYKVAEGFGSGLASFLNGLISPELFGSVGKTIAGSLNTAIKVALSFAETFDFEGFGDSISKGITEFFREFNAEDFANAIDAWVQGLWTAFKTIVSNKEMWKEAISDVKDFLTHLDFETVEIIIGAITIKKIGKLALAFGKTWLEGKIASLIAGLKGITIPQLLLSISSFGLATINTPAFMEIATRIYGQLSEAIHSLLPQWAYDFLSNLGAGLVVGAVAGSWFPGAGTIAGAIIGSITMAITGTKIDGKSILMHIVNGIFNFDLTRELSERATKLFGDVKNAFEEKDWLRIGTDILLGIANGIGAGLAFLVEPIADMFDAVFDGICSIFGIHSPATEMEPLGENILLGVVSGFTGAFERMTHAIEDFFKNIVTPSFTTEKWKESFGSITNALSQRWTDAKTWWDEKKSALSKVKFNIPSLKDLLSSAWTKAKTWWNKNVKLKIPSLKFKVTYSTPSGAFKKAIVKALNLQGWPSLGFYATGGFPEDGTFRASHGEIMGRFDNGKSVVANNKQITDGISAAVYQGNRENNALLRQELQLMQAQNELLSRILEKETGISSSTLFNEMRKEANSYFRRTGQPAFI